MGDASVSGMPTRISHLYVMFAIIGLVACGGRDTRPPTTPTATEQPEPSQPVPTDDGCKQAVQALVVYFYEAMGAIPVELFDPERMRELACTKSEKEMSCESLGMSEEQCTRLEAMSHGLIELGVAVAERCEVPPPEKPLFPTPGSPQALWHRRKRPSRHGYGACITPIP